MNPREGERQRRILYAAAFLRALAIGLMAVLIALYAARLGMSAAQIGVILSSALWGAALATVVTLWIGPRVSERALLVGWAAAPMLAGVLMEWGGLGVPLVAAGFTKLAYDVFLWREFRRVKPPEELASA